MYGLNLIRVPVITDDDVLEVFVSDPGAVLRRIEIAQSEGDDHGLHVYLMTEGGYAADFDDDMVTAAEFAADPSRYNSRLSA